MDVTTAGCCDNDDNLSLCLFLPGSPFTGDESAPVDRPRLQRHTYRPVKEREALVKRLVDWRETAWSRHPHRAVVTRRWILTNETATALSKVPAMDFRGPETVSEIADRTEEWTSVYAPDIYNVISRFDNEMRVRKIYVKLSRGIVKKVRSETWQKRVNNWYAGRAECALIHARAVLEEISEFKKTVREEKKRLLRLDATTADDMDWMKKIANVHRSHLCRTLAGAVWNVEVHSNFLQEAVTWSKGLFERDDDGSGDGEGQDEAGNTGEVTTHIPPPVQN